MTREQPVTAVENALHRRWRLLLPVYVILAIVALIGIIGTIPGAEPNAVLRRHC
jgi:ABC-type multidrug transport system permease subunit